MKNHELKEKKDNSVPWSEYYVCMVSCEIYNEEKEDVGKDNLKVRLHLDHNVGATTLLFIYCFKLYKYKNFLNCKIKDFKKV